MLLANGGMLPQYPLLEGEQKISPRKKGVKQGALLFLLGVVLVPILAVFTSFAPGRLGNMFEFFTILSALLCFTGGPTPPAARVSALPPAAANSAGQWRPRPQTAEILQPPSVTDHTTRLLDKSDSDTD